MGLRQPYSGPGLSAIDAKGRVAIPVDLRRKIEANSPGAGTIQLNTHDSRPCLLVFDTGYTQQKYEDFRARVQAEIAAGRAVPDAAAYDDDYGSTEEAGFDSSGRFIMPKLLRQEVGLTDWAVFIGVGDMIEVWCPRAFLAVDRPERAKTQRRVRALLADKGVEL